MERTPQVQPKARYASYLLRFWQVQNDVQATWVASVQSTAGGEQRPFASVDALIEFLRTQFGGDRGAGNAASPEPAEVTEKLE